MAKWTFDEDAEELICDSLYFIRESGGPIKIGRGNPQERIKALQTGNPRKLEIVAELPNAGIYEALWHKAFDSLRISGEWFDPHECLQVAIDWATKGESWIDEAPVPEGVDRQHFRNLMLDAHCVFIDLFWMGQTESQCAKRAMEYVEQNLNHSSEQALKDIEND